MHYTVKLSLARVASDDDTLAMLSIAGGQCFYVAGLAFRNRPFTD